ncbi:immunoglobulin kappa light chain-like [Halichoeres trimaculatus]|uniref:immunoglobulin kappa light chain-like n=1 Tax=Halichoeres trimaculatus TaxID=147232 RepID=UPI003D9E078B
MTSPNFLLCLIGLLLGPMAETTALKPTSSLLHESREAGQKLTLQCLNDDESVTHVTWFKHAVGEKLQLISSVYKYTTNDSLQGEFRKNPRFSLDAQKGKNHLTISDLQVSDSATYYCLSCRYCMMDIVETVHVHVKSSSLSIPAVIHQSGPESIQPGGSVTLNCSVHTGSCDGEHRVYWFKDSEESQPGAIYTSGGRNDECERKAESQTHTCTYKLPLKKLDVSHAGTYHCAVVSCGHIVFGDGTRLDFKDQGIYPGFLVYFLSGGWAFTTILALILVCKKDKGSCKCARLQNLQLTNKKGRHLE